MADFFGERDLVILGAVGTFAARFLVLIVNIFREKFRLESDVTVCLDGAPFIEDSSSFRQVVVFFLNINQIFVGVQSGFVLALCQT